MKLATILILIIFSGCLTENKVNSWLKDHPTKAAGYCADNFPPDTLSRIVTDSVDAASYEAALNNMHTYSDSLFMTLKKQRESYKPTPQQPCPPAINLDSLRKAVDVEMRKRLTPCKDTVKVVTNTIVDRAREKQLQGRVDEKDATISTRDKRITELEAQVKGLKKWPWLFWLLVALIGGYTILKLRYRLPF